MKILKSTLPLILICNILVAQSIKSDTIPFLLTDHNNIAIEAILNEKDTVLLMFHTAAHSISLTEEAVKKVSKLDFNNPTDMKTWGGGGTTRASENNKLQIKTFEWEGETVWEGKYSGPGTDGKFGPNLFEGKIIQVDFENRQLVIHSKLPKLEEEYQKMSLTLDRGMMFIEGNSTVEDSTFDNTFLIHSGYAGSVLFDDVFVADHGLNEKLEVISEKELKDSAGNVLKTKKAVMPKFSIGNIEFADAPVGFFDGAIGRQKMSVLGGDILKRFHILFDISNESIYLKENSLKSTPYSSI